MQFNFFKKRKSLHIASNTDLLTKNPDPILSEALKSTRNSVMYTLSGVEDGGRTLLMTSAFSAEGKTTTCINLATTLAQTEAKVLLIDADLRKPKVHTYLNVENNKGLANHLAGFASEYEIIHRMDEFNFDYITAGERPPNPAELLASKRFAPFVEKMKARYDYIVFDTPPVNAVADALAMIPVVENVVFVCRCGVSIMSEVKKAISALEFTKANLLGFITIDAREKKADYYNKYSGYYNY